MARLFFLLVRVAIVVAGLALCPASAEAPKWPPDDPGQGTAKVEITTAWAGRLRDIREFADLQKAAGAGGRLASIENAGDAPHAVYTWTGAGGRGAMRAFVYRAGGFAAIVTPADSAGEIIVNNFGAFVCTGCSPPVRACGRRPSWVPHTLHWDTFDCGCTLTGPQSVRAGKC